MKTDLFQSCGHCWVFQICWHTECSTFIASSFRNQNNSAGIPSPPLALFTWCFLRPTWLHIPGCLALGEWSHHRDYLGHEDLFLYSSSVYSCHFLMSSASVRNQDGQVRSWWRVLTKHGPLEKEMASHFSICALRTPWTIWKGKKYRTLKDELLR